ncbi:TPA: glycosyltransferase, partial [Yersinia enterocolitica]
VISGSGLLGCLGIATSLFLLLTLSVPLVILFIISVIFKKIFKNKLSRILHRIKSISTLPLNNLKNRPWAIELHNVIRKKELSRLIVLINQEKEIKAWLIPTLFWPEVKQIAAKKVIVAPDIVMYDFPIYFSDSNSSSSLNRLEESISIADKFITYSEYVKDMHLVMMNGVNPQDVSVIGHGRIDMSHFLSIQGKKQDLSVQKEVAKEILIQYRNKHLSGNHYWSFTEFDKINYILYSSQVRGYKNIIILLKLVKILNFERNIDVKLVVTGDIFKDSNLSKYINKNKLESIVLSAYDIPSEVLAAFNSLAKLSVNPTLFEGGFPFTFCEAYSVGTPSILSNIPVVRERTKYLSADMQDRMLFNPYDIHDLVEKVLWGLEHNDELLEMQQDLYNSYPTWKQVAKKYIDVLTVE